MADEMNNDMPVGEQPLAAQPEKARAIHLRAAERFRTVKLEWPIEYDGKTYTEVTVRRMTSAEVADFLTDAADGKAPALFDCPLEVLDALDDDDAAEVNKAVADFLPRRWRADEPSQTQSTTTQP